MDCFWLAEETRHFTQATLFLNLYLASTIMLGRPAEAVYLCLSPSYENTPCNLRFVDILFNFGDTEGLHHLKNLSNIVEVLKEGVFYDET